MSKDIIIQNLSDNSISSVKTYVHLPLLPTESEINGKINELKYEGIMKGLSELDKLNPNRNDNYNGKTGTTQQQDTPDGTSILGTPVWGRLVVESGSYIDTNTGNVINYPSITIDTVLFTLSQVHHVVLTPIQGRDYEVVEYIGKASFRINCKGGIFGKNNNRPKKDIDNLKLILASNQPLIIQSNSFLTEWGISEIVILDKNIPQIAGGYNYQLFEFNAIQNTPVILAQQQNVS